MAIVTLKTLWLNDFSNPSDYQSFPFMTALSRTLHKGGAQRIYGNGRMRVSTTAELSKSWAVTLPNLTADQVAWLEAHVGRTITCRDDRGHLLYAVYFEVPVTEHQFNSECDASLSLTEVTATLAV